MVVVCVCGDMVTRRCSSLVVKKNISKRKEKGKNPYPGDTSWAPQFVILSSPRFLAPCRPIIIV